MKTDRSRTELDEATGRVRAEFEALAALATTCAAELSDGVARIALRATEVLQGGNTLLFCGNGGSAADAQHLAAEYVVRFARERRPLPAIALTVDTSALTAAGNDFGYDEVFARQVGALGRAGDLLFLHSTSGNSPNLIRAAEAAKAAGVETVGVLAKGGGALAPRVDHALIVPTEVTAHAQEIHLRIGHAVCEIVDRHFHAREATP